MKKIYFVLLITLGILHYAQPSVHDTQGNIEVNVDGQLQYTLPIETPPGIKSVAPQINLIYTSGTGTGIAGYGWNISGLTSISRMGKTIEKDGEFQGIRFNNNDFYSFNGQRLIYKSGGSGPVNTGVNGALSTTEKYSNIKVKAVGSVTGQEWQGPEYWEVTFEDGSQAWYGATTNGASSARTPLEYNIVKWKDAQGNYITYNYLLSNNVSVISSIQWGGNEELGKPHFNTISFNYIGRDLKENAYLNGIQFVQDKLLKSVVVSSSGSQFKKYVVSYNNDIVNNDNNKVVGYQFADTIKVFNSQNEAANSAIFSTKKLSTSMQEKSFVDFSDVVGSGDYNGDGLIDFILKQTAQNGKPEGYYLYFDKLNNESSPFLYLGPSSDFSSFANFTIKPSNNIVKARQGLVTIKNIDSPSNPQSNGGIEIKCYSINLDPALLNTLNNPLVLEHSKFINPTDYLAGSSYPQFPPANYGYYIKSDAMSPKDIDVNLDGVSELIFTIYDKGYYKRQNPYPYEWVTVELGYRYVIIDQDDFASNTFTKINTPTTTNALESAFAMDFDNDKVLDIIKIEAPNYNNYESTNVTYYTRNKYSNAVLQRSVNTPVNVVSQYFVKKIGNSGNYKYVLTLKQRHSIKGLRNEVKFGDLNGDGNIEIITPLEKNLGSDSHIAGYSFYLNNGKTLSESFQGFIEYYNSNYIQNGYYEKSHNGIIDIDNDGKADFLSLYAGYNTQGSGFSNLILTKLNEFQYDPTNIQFKWSYKLTSLLTNHRGGNAIFPIYGDFRINNTNSKILFISNSLANSNDRKIISYFHYNLGSDKNISAINQGGITTSINYKELDPSVNSNFYAPAKVEQYPYMELDRLPQTFAVSQITQAGRKQDFRYRGMITHLHGRGMVGFRQTARSSWYADGLENTKVWSGIEIDPLNDAVPTKEWSVRPNNEDQIFDLSVQNPQILTLKQTTYQIDLVTGIAYNAIKAIVPKTNITKDFQKNITYETTITYGQFYLPKLTETTINGSFAKKTTELNYIHNQSGEGKNYFIGRPDYKIERVDAYGDTKWAKEVYTYNNNLLETLTKFDNNTVSWIREKYYYDEGSAQGFGNITKKEITNYVDAQIISSQAQYEPKGRFVIRKTDNLGLQTNYTYNDWGQILTESDVFGNIVTNSYDNWGKPTASTSTLSGTTTYDYYRDSSYNLRTTQNNPDGSIAIKFVNALGQNYKTVTKAFEQNKYVSKETKYDNIGRITYESLPYFENSISSNYASSYGSIISYNDSFFPAKVTAKEPYNGKEIETAVSGRVTTTIEKNGYLRTYTKTADALGNTINSSDPGGNIIFEYNANGQQTKASYGGNIVKTSYDEWGRKSAFYDPANGEYSYEYTGAGDIRKEISKKGYKKYTYRSNGLLDSVEERSNDNVATVKNYSFSYNQYWQIAAKSGTSNGKSYTTAYGYYPNGRFWGSTEYLEGREFRNWDMVYDSYGNIKSYKKEIVSNGATTSVEIENFYSPWDGSLYQVKEKGNGKLLWELQSTNAKGQVENAKLGATQITNTYSQLGYISTAKHISPIDTIINNYYIFEGQKNELSLRYNYISGLNETFGYDNNNRLTSWTNPKTGQTSYNTYDEKGRITANDQIGNIGFNIGGNVYRASNIKLNANGMANYGIGGQNILLQNIKYNENNDPVKIRGRQNDYAFEYGLSANRQVMYYGGKFENNQNASFTKYYSEDASFEIKRNKWGQEKHVIYVGGSPYESNIVYIRSFGSSTTSVHFLHKDYLGNILAIVSEGGYPVERRHYDAWGKLTSLRIAGGLYDPDNYTGELLVDRGYTSHELLMGVQLIHMNGRLYDPLLRRFLNADENIQDPFNTQNYNKYGYVMNNPLLYNDPSGEFWVAGFFLTYIGPAIYAAIVGAGIGAAIYVAKGLFTNNWSWGGFAKSVLLGAVSGFATGGLANVFSATGFFATTGVGALTGGLGGGIDALFNGTDFLKGVLRGAAFGGSIAGISWGIAKIVKAATISAGNHEYRLSDSPINDIGNGSENVKYSYGTIQEFQDAYGGLGNYGVRNIYLKTPEGYGVAADGLFYKKSWWDNLWGLERNVAKGEILGVTFPSNDIYMSKAAFASKSQFVDTITHETAHVILQNSKSAALAASGVSTNMGMYARYLDNNGHVSIRKMSIELFNKNPWLKLPWRIPLYYFQNSQPALDKLLTPLIKPFNF